MEDQEPPSPKDPFEVANAYLDRLERLVLKVLGRRFKTADGLWKVQVDLLKFQREVQASIAKRKAERPTDELREQIESLRIVRWHARRFGDALAWLLYRGERRLLYPLSWNDYVPVEPENGRPSPATMAAEVLAERLGFPLLHDMTDLLRVGDCSFIRFGEEGPPRIVEFKSRVLNEERQGDQVRIEYQVTAVWPADGRPPPDMGAASPNKPTKPLTKQAALNSKRFHEQLKRMSRAHAHRTAEAGKATTIDGRPTLMLEGHIDETPGHWGLIRRLIRRAKRTGFAHGTAEQATLYVVIFSKDGFHSAEDLGLRRIRDLPDVDIWLADRSKNLMRIEGLPDPRQPGPHRFLPYYLYPIPRTAVFDIMHGRLAIISILNVGRLVAAIEDQGLKVEVPGRRGQSMSVLTDIDVDGARLFVDLANLEENVIEMIMEARSLSYVAGMAAMMAEGIALLMPDMVRETWAREAEEEHGTA